MLPWRATPLYQPVEVGTEFREGPIVGPRFGIRRHGWARPDRPPRFCGRVAMLLGKRGPKLGQGKV